MNDHLSVYSGFTRITKRLSKKWTRDSRNTKRIRIDMTSGLKTLMHRYVVLPPALLSDTYLILICFNMSAIQVGVEHTFFYKKKKEKGFNTPWILVYMLVLFTSS